MALSFPSAPERGWLERFAIGLGEAQAAFGMHLIGGDTDRRDGPVTVSITAFGHCPAGHMVRRGTARPGHRIYVTGTIGDAALGLQLRTEPAAGLAALLGADETVELVQRSLRPQPRLGFQSSLRQFASAAMDVSDGLVRDIERMAAAGGIGAVLWLGETPLSAPAVALVRRDPGLLQRLATAGDDYELLIAVPATVAAAFERDADVHGRVTRVGEFTASAGTTVLDVDGQPLALAETGYAHF
jgi:thiamine-monophosphate kinase